jgi:DNA polymerase I-like protein with 3'-5' exonuclease and polymerase domains
MEEVKKFFCTFNSDKFAFDTETSSLSYDKLKITGISFCDGHNAVYIPINSLKNTNKLPCAEPTELFDYLNATLFKDNSKDKIIVAHNIVFDGMVISKYGAYLWNAKVLFDTMVAAHLIDENRESHGLKQLSKEILKVNVTTFDEVGENHYTKQFFEYGMSDAINTWNLACEFSSQLIKKDLMKLMLNVESDFQKVLIEMKIEGVLIDKSFMIETTNKLRQSMIDIQRDLYKLLNEPVTYQLGFNRDIIGIKGKYNFDSPQQVADILFKRLGLEVVETTEKGQPQTGKITINKYKKTVPFVAKLNEYKICSKLLNAFFSPMPQHIESDGKIRPQFPDIGTVTGRLACISKGTKIQTVRDFSKNMDGTNIENIKIGDLVYCYNDNNELTIQKVKNIFNNGIKMCVKINWYSLSNYNKGYLICTPDHKLKCPDGVWRNSYELNTVTESKVGRLRRIGKKIPINSRVLSCRLSPKCNMYIQCYSWQKEEKNARFICKQLYGIQDKKDMHTHHMDNNKFNDTVENLKVLSHSEHARIHETLKHNRHEGGSFKNKDIMLKSYNTRMFNLKMGITIPKRGEDKHNFKKFTKEHCIFLIKKYKGHIKYMINAREANFDVIHREMKRYNFDMKNTHLYYIDKEECILKLKELQSINKVAEFYNLGYYRIKKYIEYHNITLEDWEIPEIKYAARVRRGEKLSERLERLNSGIMTNHIITSIEKFGECEVYDLEIENSHNYIANELCVHNCNSPNMQQIPKSRDEFPIETRQCFTVPEGYSMISSDFSGQELRVTAHVSNEPGMIEAFEKNYDLHLSVANNVWNLGVPKEELQTNHVDYEKYKKQFKKQRDNAKAVSFGLIYGISAKGLKDQLNCSEEEAQNIMDDYFKTYFNLKKSIDNTHIQLKEKGYVKNLYGRYRHFQKNDKGYYDGRCYRQAFNFIIQSSSSDMLRCAMNNVFKISKQHPEWDLKAILSVHDEGVYQCKSEYAQVASIAVKKAFEESITLRVPVIAECGVGKNYADVK